MSTVLRRNRKGSDRDITRLNCLGFSLKTIASKLSCHPTSISLRLTNLKIEPADTRRAFMEDIFTDLPQETQDNVADMLESDGFVTIKDYVRGLITADQAARHPISVS